MVEPPDVKLSGWSTHPLGIGATAPLGALSTAASGLKASVWIKPLASTASVTMSWLERSLTTPVSVDGVALVSDASVIRGPPGSAASTVLSRAAEMCMRKNESKCAAARWSEIGRCVVAASSQLSCRPTGVAGIATVLELLWCEVALALEPHPAANEPVISATARIARRR